MIHSLRAALLPLAVATLTLVIFIVDAFTPIDIAIAVLYGTVILLAAQSFSRRTVIGLALLCVALTLTAYGIGHHATFSKAALGRCLVSLAAITIIAFLALKWQRGTDELLQREQALRQADRHKDEFLATLAHELRNPLAAIHSVAQLLKASSLDSEQIERIHTLLLRQTAHLNHLVDDLLDVARVRKGLVRLNTQAVDMKQVIADAIEQVQPVVDSKKQRLTVHVSKALAMVPGDHKRLVQVIANLLNNAAKYTPERGKITLDMHRDVANVTIRVTDNGIGIEPALLPQVFDLFTQAERTLDRSHGGLGLGLALVKSIVELHGGEVEAHSEGRGKGSCFTVIVPLISPHYGLPAESTRHQMKGCVQNALRLMIVDDNEDVTALLGALLATQGHEVMAETDPRAALFTARERLPQVCILDIGLPGMNGYQLAQELRMLPQTKDAVLIALTGYEQIDDMVLAQAAGFDHYLVKTIDTQTLVQNLRQILDQDASTASSLNPDKHP